MKKRIRNNIDHLQYTSVSTESPLFEMETDDVNVKPLTSNWYVMRTSTSSFEPTQIVDKTEPVEVMVNLLVVKL